MLENTLDLLSKFNIAGPDKKENDPFKHLAGQNPYMNPMMMGMPMMPPMMPMGMPMGGQSGMPMGGQPGMPYNPMNFLGQLGGFGVPTSMGKMPFGFPGQQPSASDETPKTEEPQKKVGQAKVHKFNLQLSS